jgi:hypothetical protein
MDGDAGARSEAIRDINCFQACRACRDFSYAGQYSAARYKGAVFCFFAM